MSTRFQPGKQKTGGRSKGTPNKKTKILQDLFEELGLDVPKELARTLNAGTADDDEDNPILLTAYERARVLLDLMQYLYPKRKAVDHTHAGPNGEPVFEDHRKLLARLVGTPETFEALEKISDAASKNDVSD